MNDAGLMELSRQVGEMLRQSRLRLATAESCTGGWVAKAVTDIAGSSAWFVCGFATYSNEAKRTTLSVSAVTLDTHGAVSENTALEMVAGALDHSEADVALSVTGIAGPDGGSDGKPVGMVCFAWGRRGARIDTQTRHFEGDRDQVRRQSVAHALHGLIAYINATTPA